MTAEEDVKGIDRVRIVGAGFGWSLRSAEQALLTGLAAAQYEILVCAYHLNTGAKPVWDAILAAARRGVACVIVCNDLANHAPARRMLLELLATGSDTVTVYECRESDRSYGSHAKAVVVDRSYAVIGSSNLSFRGLNAAHEMGVVIEGPSAAAAAKAIAELVQSRFTRRWPA